MKNIEATTFNFKKTSLKNDYLLLEEYERLRIYGVPSNQFNLVFYIPINFV